MRRVFKYNKLIDYTISRIEVEKLPSDRYVITIYFEDIVALTYKGMELHFDGNISLASHNLEWWGTVYKAIRDNDVEKTLSIIHNFENKNKKAKKFTLEYINEFIKAEEKDKLELKLLPYMKKEGENVDS